MTVNILITELTDLQEEMHFKNVNDIDFYGDYIEIEMYENLKEKNTNKQIRTVTQIPSNRIIHIGITDIEE